MEALKELTMIIHLPVHRACCCPLCVLFYYYEPPECETEASAELAGHDKVLF